MILYSYWRSTTSLRVRAVLNLKGFDYDIVPVNLIKGEQSDPAFTAINPSGGVPVLQLEDGTILSQSHAIIEYLDRVRPTPPLLQKDPVARAQEMAAVYSVAMDVHPLNNLKVLTYLSGPLAHSPEEVKTYVRHWMGEGLRAFQTIIRPLTPYAFGNHIGLADICLVSQMVNARKWGMDLSPFSRLVEIDALCRTHPAIDAAMPENQPDAA